MGGSAPGRGVAECFTEMFGYVSVLRQVCARAQPGFAEVKSRLDGMIEESARRMREWGLDPRDYDDGRFAVFAWVDETILNMPWTHREAWRAALLQSTFYSTTSAGSEFFDRLNRLRDDQQGVREVYFTCLSLGFRGRYHQEGDEFLLTQLKKSNLKSLVGNTGGPGSFAGQRLFGGAYETVLGGPVEEGKTQFWTLPRVVTAAAPPLFVGLLWVIYTFVLNGVLGNVLTRVGGGAG